MSNTRPTPGRRATLRTDKNADDALEAGLKITIDGETYEVRLADVTSTLARELRRGTGMSFNQLMVEVANNPDADSIASWIWLARRIAGDKVDVDDVVVTYAQILADDFEVQLPTDDAPGADSPEA